MVDAEPEHDLGSVPDRKDVLHQVTFGLGVVHETVHVAKALAEGGQVERRLVMGRRVQDDGDPGQRERVDRGGEQVGVAGHHVRIGDRDGVAQAGADRTVEGNPSA